jgi:hypothetical protein
MSEWKVSFPPPQPSGVPVITKTGRLSEMILAMARRLLHNWFKPVDSARKQYQRVIPTPNPEF